MIIKIKCNLKLLCMKKLFLLLAILCGFVVAQAQEQEEEIVDTIPVAPKLISTVSNDTIHLYWDYVIGAISYKLYYEDKLFIDNIGINDTAYNVVTPVPGTYCFTVTAVNGVGESEHSNKECAEVKAEEDLEVPAAPILEAKLVNDSALLTWNAVELATYYNVYHITDEGDKLISTSEETVYKVKLTNPGEYCFYVTAANLAGESEKSNEACVTYEVPGESIKEIASSFNIYPNPVSDKLYIEAESEIEEVVVYDIFGRQQKLSAISGQQSVVDVKDLNSGVYFVKVVSENGEIVKRFVKK